jgi:hypothetical protein
VLRDDLRPDAVLAMFSAIVERALWLTVGEVMTPEEATETAVTIFLNGARKPEWLSSVASGPISSNAATAAPTIRS